MIIKLYAVFFIILMVSLIINPNAIAGENNNFKLISTGSEKVKISVNNQESKLSLPLEEAIKIKERFLKIEEEYEGIEKINQQIDILKKISLFPSDFNIDSFSSFSSNYYKTLMPLFYSNFFKLDIGGPMIVSHLTINGRITCFFSLKPINTTKEDIKLNGIFDNFFLNTTRGYLGAYGGYVFRPVFITAIGPKIIISHKNPYLFFSNYWFHVLVFLLLLNI